jgi:hypothetical protein
MDKKYGHKWQETPWSIKDFKSFKEGLTYDNILEVAEGGIQTAYNILNWVWFDRRKRKIDVRLARWDTWSADNTLGHIIFPMLVQLKATKQGAPMTDDKDVPEHLRSKDDEGNSFGTPKKNSWDTDSNHFKRWDWILDEMIWAFEQKCRDDWEGDYYEYEYDDTEQFGMKLIWEDREGQKAHQARMTKAFALFGKYYENLWN